MQQVAENIYTTQPVALTDKERNFIDWFTDIDNLEEIFAEFFFIKDKKGKIVPLILNTSQKVVLKEFQKAYKSGKLLRFIILKARQRGISTLWEAIIYWLSITKFYFKSVIVGHKGDASDNLFEMFKRYNSFINPGIAPVEKRNNKKELNFAKLGSIIEVQTAEGRDSVKRSDTLQAGHLTEVAFWPDAKKTLLALLQTIPDQPGTVVVLESTANGIGGPFYNRWNIAYNDISVEEEEILGEEEKEDLNASSYIPIFINWLIDDEYSLPFASESLKKKFIEDIGNPKYNSFPGEEELLLKEHKATYEHLNWRRYTITDKCDGDIEQFHQEYPTTPEEAFVASGRPVFDSRLCNENFVRSSKDEKNGKIPLRRGDLEVVYLDSKEKDKLIAEGKTSYYDLRKFISEVKFIDNPKGLIKIYEDITPRKGEKFRFAAGGDVAEGLEQGDYDAIKILDRSTMKVAITFHGHLDPDLLAEELHKLQLFLGSEIYFGIERNNHGLTTINSANKLGVKQYYTEIFDAGYPVDTDKLGFSTNSVTRTEGINTLKEWIREKLFEDKESGFWKEALTFVRNAKGKMQAQNKDRDPGTKCFDDRIIAAMIMIRVHLWMPNYRVDKPKREIPEYMLRKANKFKKKRSVMSH